MRQAATTKVVQVAADECRRGRKRQRVEEADILLPRGLNQVSPMHRTAQCPPIRHSSYSEEEEQAMQARLKLQKLHGIDPRIARIRNGRRKLDRGESLVVAEDLVLSSGHASYITSASAQQKRQPLGLRDHNSLVSPERTHSGRPAKKAGQGRGWVAEDVLCYQQH